MNPTGQTADGTWEVGVRRTIPVDQDTAWTLLTALLHEQPAVTGVRSETPGEVLRADYQPADWAQPSTLQLRAVPAAGGTTLAIHHERLADATTREAMRQHWADALQRVIDGGAAR